jgi:hypothetical protein
MYIFADYVQKFIEGFTLNGAGTGGTISHLLTAAQNTGNPISFGEDRYGDMYILFGGINTVYKFQDSSYQRIPKAFYVPVLQGDGSYLLQGLAGKNLTYQWLKNGTEVPGATSPDFLINASGNYSLKVTNTLGLSDTSSIFVFGALPLGLKDFTASRITQEKVSMQWETSQEINIRSFKLQRKSDNETTFRTIATVPGKGINGNTNAGFQYEFVDSSATGNTIFYRLQVLNYDGSFSYSAIRIIKKNNLRSFIIYPNPSHGQLNILLNDFVHPIQLTIYDYAGRKVGQQNLVQQLTNINLPTFKGVYFFQLNDGGKNVGREKIIVE